MFLNKNRYKRLGWFGLILASAFFVVFAALKTFEENLVFFYTPSQIINGEAPKNRPIRVPPHQKSLKISKIVHTTSPAELGKRLPCSAARSPPQRSGGPPHGLGGPPRGLGGPPQGPGGPPQEPGGPHKGPGGPPQGPGGPP